MCGRRASNRSTRPSPCSADKRERLAKAERERLDAPGLAGAALGLVGGDDHRGILVAQPARDFLVERGQTLAAVDDEQGDVGFAHRGLGLLAHAPGERGGIDLLEPGGVHDPELEPEQVPLALAAVAGDPGAIVDQRHALADEAIEQGRFSDVGSADDGYGR